MKEYTTLRPQQMRMRPSVVGSAEANQKRSHPLTRPSRKEGRARKGESSAAGSGGCVFICSMSWCLVKAGGAGSPPRRRPLYPALFGFPHRLARVADPVLFPGVQEGVVPVGVVL